MCIKQANVFVVTATREFDSIFLSLSMQISINSNNPSKNLNFPVLKIEFQKKSFFIPQKLNNVQPQPPAQLDDEFTDKLPTKGKLWRKKVLHMTFEIIGFLLYSFAVKNN